MAELNQCPKPSFWAIFIELAEQGICHPSELSPKEIAETVSLLSTDSTMIPLPFEFSSILSMVLAFMVLIQSSFLSSPSNLMWLMTSVFSTLYKFILEPYIAVYKLVGPGKLCYIALETFSIFLLIAFCYLYRGSIAGLGLGVKFHAPRDAQSITDTPNISPNCQLKKCTISLSAWFNKPFNRRAMILDMKIKSNGESKVFGEKTTRSSWEKKKIMTVSTEFIVSFKRMVGDLCARLRWAHAALALSFVLIIQITAVTASVQSIPGIIFQCFVWVAGVFLTCYRYMEAVVIAKAKSIPGIFNKWLVGAKELFLPIYQSVVEVFQQSMASFRENIARMNEEFVRERMMESMRTEEVDGEYRVVHDSEQAFSLRFRNANKIVREGLFLMLGVWFLFNFLPWIVDYLSGRDA